MRSSIASMKPRRGHLGAMSLAAGLLLGPAHHAAATDVFRLEGYGPVSRAMGGTGAAHDIGLAGLMTNPATLALLPEGGQVDAGLDLVWTNTIKVRNQATGESVTSERDSLAAAYYAPQLGYAWRSGDFTAGIGVFAQGGLGAEYGKRSFLSRTAAGTDTGLPNASRLLAVNIPMGIAYQPTDRLTLGATVDAIWSGLNLDVLFGADQVGALIGSGRARGSLVGVLGGVPALEGVHFSLSKSHDIASGVDAWGYAGRLGLTYRLSPATLFGASYNAQSRLDDLQGRATLTAVSGVAGQIALDGDIRIRNFQMPASLTLGLSHRIDEQWTVAADVSRVFWKKVMKDIDVAFVADGGGTLHVLIPQDYRDVTIAALGVAYRSGDWTLRAGARFATEALRSENLLAVIPAIPRRHLSAGFSYALGAADSIHFAYSHALRETMDNSRLPATSAPIRAEHAQDNFVLGYTHRF